MQDPTVMPETSEKYPQHRPSQRALNIPLNEDEVEAVIETFVAEDSKKTFTRVLVENYLSKYDWYNPAKNYKNAPSLSKAYAYYEHITLPRHVVGENATGHILRRAEPGESVEKTELYPLAVPSSSLIEWGIGVDQYFTTVRFLSCILLGAGLLSLPSAMFYASAEYDPLGDRKDLTVSLRGTAICTSGEWVVCTDCTFDQWYDERSSMPRIAESNGTFLVYRNTCKSAEFWPPGLMNWVSFLFVMLTIGWTSAYLRAREVRFDEDKLTATDYSILVKNPPSDAIDPDDWRDFFMQFATGSDQVTVVTVALSNEELLRKLIDRRIHRNNLRLKLPKDTDMDDPDAIRIAVAQLVEEREAESKTISQLLFESCILPLLRMAGMFPPAEVLMEKLFDLKEEIQQLQKEKYDVTKIYVTFETEESQRTALKAFALPKLDVWMNRTDDVPPSLLFHGRILDVAEPPEPSSVRWLDLSAGKLRRLIARLLTFVITTAVLAGAASLTSLVRYSDHSYLAAYMITGFNSLFPLVVSFLMIFEKHHSEGSFQTSLYLKITVFRWANTALLTKLLTPFTHTLSNEKDAVISQITALFWSELYFSPLLRLLDLGTNFQKHILAPRSPTQEEMNNCFQGTEYSLGERYTDLTKILFLCFFYSALIPTSFFFGAAILFVQYYVDMYCLTRIWARTPSLGSELARFSRRYFFSGAVVAYVVVSSYAWAQFPYDNVCKNPNQTEGAAGIYPNATYENGTDIGTINVTQNISDVYCSQRWKDFDGWIWVFPPTPNVQPADEEWMTDQQVPLTYFYGATAFLVVMMFLLCFFKSSIRSLFQTCLRGIYVPSGQQQYIDFSSNGNISGYVPQIKCPGFPFPFLACNVDEIGPSLIGWNDPSRSYDHYNLMFDVPWEGMGRTTRLKQDTNDPTNISAKKDTPNAPIYSIVKHYPPVWALKSQDKSGRG